MTLDMNQIHELIQRCENHKSFCIASDDYTNDEVENDIFNEFGKIYDYVSDKEFMDYILKATSAEMMDKVIEKINSILTCANDKVMTWFITGQVDGKKIKSIDTVAQKIGVSVSFMNDIRVVSSSTIDKIARQFSKLIKRDLGLITMRKVIEKNQTKEYKVGGYCATHEFCDANVYMHEACLKFGFDCFDEDEYVKKKATIYFNKAWDIAKKNNFYIS